MWENVREEEGKKKFYSDAEQMETLEFEPKNSDCLNRSASLKVHSGEVDPEGLLRSFHAAIEPESVIAR